MFANKQYIGFFDHCRGQGLDIVCASVLYTEGSTYRKPGATMLINVDGDFIGVVSGGCFEEDLIGCAKGVLQAREGKYVKHDLRIDDDNAEAWGQGIGCNGLMELWIEPFYHTEHYGALGKAYDLSRMRRDVILARSIKTSGVHAILSNGDIIGHPENHEICQAAGAYRSESGAYYDRKNGVFFQAVAAPYRLLILGAGPGCEPLVKMADTLGWYTTVCDTRKDYLRYAGSADDKRLFDAVDDAGMLCEAGFDAGVVMSHNFTGDMAYLNALLESNVDYIGIMGPKQRTRRMLGQLNAGEVERDLRIHNPVGLDLGGESPESIALSIVAEIEACRYGKKPVSLRDKMTMAIHA